MNFQLTADQQTFRDSVLRLSEKHLKADARERAHGVEYPWDVARLFAANGLLVESVPRASVGVVQTAGDTANMALTANGWWSRCHAWDRVLYFYRARVPGLKQLGSDRVVI